MLDIELKIIGDIVKDDDLSSGEFKRMVCSFLTFTFVRDWGYDYDKVEEYFTGYNKLGNDAAWVETTYHIEGGCLTEEVIKSLKLLLEKTMSRYEQYFSKLTVAIEAKDTVSQRHIKLHNN